MNVVEQKQAKKLVINEEKVRTIEVNEIELAPRTELEAYDQFEAVPPPAYGRTRN